MAMIAGASHAHADEPMRLTTALLDSTDTRPMNAYRRGILSFGRLSLPPAFLANTNQYLQIGHERHDSTALRISNIREFLCLLVEDDPIPPDR